MENLIQIAKRSQEESKPFPEAEGTIKVNESVGQAAFYYEKLRNSLDWQDEHLFLKNAIKRILKRRVYLKMRQSDNARVILRELVWAKYFKNETIPLSYVDEVATILRKYNFLRKFVKSNQNSTQITEIVLGLAACEIERFLRPSTAQQEFLEITTNCIAGNLHIAETEIESGELSRKLHIGVARELFKFDLDQLRFDLVKNFYPRWPIISKAEAEEFGKNFDQNLKWMTRQIFDPSSYRLQRYARRHIPAFRIIWEIIGQRYDGHEVLRDEETLESAAQGIIRRRNKQIYSRVMRSIVRGIIFILLTKIILALIVEYPFELHYLGAVNYTALSVNVLLPPLLMLIIGLFIRVPGHKNTQILIRQVEEIVLRGKYEQAPVLTLKHKRSRAYLLFNILHFLSSVAILILVTWGLIALQFNLVSIVLFFFFVSLVSFLAFRIAAIAKELEVRRRDETVIIGIFNFIFLPFVYIGKVLSEQWSNYNVTLWFWDFIIEAPFKTIMSVFESWLVFVREKREDFE